jgi:hypothetical protein
MQSFMALYWPQAEKKDTMEFDQFATLGAKEQAKNAKSWPQVFSASTLSVKEGLIQAVL